MCAHPISYVEMQKFRQQQKQQSIRNDKKEWIEKNERNKRIDRVAKQEARKKSDRKWSELTNIECVRKRFG